MEQSPPKVSVERSPDARLLQAARTLPTDRGAAACISHADLFGRLTAALRPDPADQGDAAAVCSTCPLLALCPVAVTAPGG